MVLSATLYAPRLHAPQNGEYNDGAAVEAAVRAAAQYYHMYLGHLRPKYKGSTGLAFWNKRRSSLLRQHFSKLDDAWLSLEAAEEALSGKSHSSQWWGKLHHLRLLLYSEHEIYNENLPSEWEPTPLPRTLAFRSRRDPVYRISSAYDGARMASPLTCYSAFTAIHHAARALYSCRGRGASEYEKKEVRLFLERLRSDFEAECNLNKERMPALERLLSPEGEGESKAAGDTRKVVKTLCDYAAKVNQFLSEALEQFSDRRGNGAKGAGQRMSSQTSSGRRSSTDRGALTGQTH